MTIIPALVKKAESGDAEAQFSLGYSYDNGEGVPQDDILAVSWYRKAVEQGYAKAQFNLGICYAYGRGVPKDAVLAADWCRKAAEQGHATAQNNLGFCYDNGRGVPKDAILAASWYRKAAEQGYAKAQFNLGLCYALGSGVHKDDVLAVSWYRKAAEQGYAKAQFNLGLCYAHGNGVPHDAVQAASWYRKAADQGHAGAQCNLGGCYGHGSGVPEDEVLSASWLRKAADQGHAQAQCTLGECYSHGIGVTKDNVLAASWSRKAADQGNVEAQYNLGVCYDHGYGVPQDTAQAVSWYRKAAEQGDAGAQCALGLYYAHGNGVPKDVVLAASWYRRAADQGHAKAQNSLGVRYANGDGVPKDAVQAVSWFRKAADQGDANAQFNLGRHYANGDCVPRDDVLAASWYRKAADQGHAEAQKKLEAYYASGKAVPVPNVEEALARLKEMAAFPKGTWEVLSNNIRAFLLNDPSSPRAILLSGPPGTGKTTIAKAIGDIAGCKFFARTIADLKKGYIGHSAEAAKKLWEEAGAAGKAIIFLDECESVFAARSGSESDAMTKEICGVFLPYLEGVNRAGHVLFIGATNLPDIIDSAILSRFDVSITIPPPGIEQRQQILRVRLRTFGMSDALVERLTPMTEGMSGRDIDGIIRSIRQAELSGKSIDAAIDQVVSSRRSRGNSQTKKGLTWDDVAVPDAVRESLQRYVTMLTNRERLAALGIDAMPRGVLLFGPPGTGKTQIARVMAETSGCTFHSASTADVKAGYVGQSGQRVKEIFSRARLTSPCILFFDELDIIAPVRGSSNDPMTQEIIGQMLQEIDGIKDHAGSVFLMAATNNPSDIDPAILSRFTERFEIALPDEAMRANIARAILRGRAIEGSREELVAEVARRTAAGSGRDIQNLLNQASQHLAMRAIKNADVTVGLRIQDLPSK